MVDDDAVLLRCGADGVQRPPPMSETPPKGVAVPMRHEPATP